MCGGCLSTVVSSPCCRKSSSTPKYTAFAHRFEESSDVTQELIRRRQVEKAPDLALLFDSLPHLPISIGRLRLSFIFESERGIFPIGMDRDHRIVVFGVAKARQLIEAQDFQLGLPSNQFAAPNQRQVNIIEIQRMQYDGIVQLFERLRRYKGSPISIAGQVGRRPIR